MKKLLDEYAFCHFLLLYWIVICALSFECVILCINYVDHRKNLE
jgi:hypothetical protein